MVLWAHHAKSWLGIEFEVNGAPFPDGMFDHALVFAGAALMAYGLFALVRDLVRWRRWKGAPATK
jgi:hypothetical protein